MPANWVPWDNPRMYYPVDLSPFRESLQSEEWVLTPGKRLARAITEAWAREQLASQGATSAPPVDTVDGWLEARWHEQVEQGSLPLNTLIDRQQELCLWRQVILLDQTDTGEAALLNLSSAAARAKSARDALLGYATGSNAELWQSFLISEDSSAFSRWNKLFENELSKRSLVTRHEAYAQLASLTVDTKPTVSLVLSRLLPPQSLKALGQFCEIRELALSRLQKPSPRFQYAFPSREAELAAAARWASQKQAEGATSVAIISLDLDRDRAPLEYHLRDQFGCLDARYQELPVNFSTGMRLADTPLYRDALLALESGVRSIDRCELLALMQSPYLGTANEDQEPARLRLLDAAFQTGSDRFTLGELVHLMHCHAPELPITLVLDRVHGNRDTRAQQSLSFWADLIRQRLSEWGWPHRESLDSMEYQQVQRLEDSLTNLRGLSRVLETCHFGEALNHWRNTLCETIFQPQTLSGDVQVLGPREALGLRFEHLWICGVKRGVFPESPKLDAFLPATIQRQIGLPQVSGESLYLQACEFLSIWSCPSQELVLSFHRFEDGIEQDPSELLESDRLIEQPERQYPDRWFAERKIEYWVDSNAPEIERGVQRGGAGLLRDQAACPFRAMVRHRQRPACPEPPSLGFSPMERGIILHRALQTIWSELKTQKHLQMCTAEHIDALLDDALSGAFNQIEGSADRRGFSLRARVGLACWDLERDVTRRVLSAWLALEKQREVPFQVLETEAEHELDVGGLTLKLRPDRIDELPDNRRLVIDYKSQAPSRKTWMGDRLGEPQLPLYALLDPNIEGIAFAALLTSGAKWVHLGQGLEDMAGAEPLNKQTEGSADSWGALVADWRWALEQLAREFVSGEAAVRPQPGACQHCNLGPVCRVRQSLDAEGLTLVDTDT